MTVSEYKKKFIQELSPIYGQEETLSLYYWAMSEKGFSKTDLILKENEEFVKEIENDLLAIINQLIAQKPLQYIFEKAYFFGYEFKVSPATLIPRTETEELVEWILQILRSQPHKKWKILDIGTGSGCIPITLKKEFPNATIHTIDISAEAIAIAKENAQHLQADIHFIHQDILQTETLETYDLIVSNPPYVRELEKAEIQKNVLEYEPHLALFVSNKDPLIFYRKITQLASKYLAENGYLFFEINQYLGKETVEMIQNYFSAIELRKDLKGNERMVKVY
ncbi:peptide chain release factor N(5)-glutamine methyltransferase [Capnocytophaga sp. ARDL2]|uniref:peptide chain release factor N(5)-glutamine methyltransferase n=1 Tax=Capnocytophaga sp. ARDL2 TaxID=3238809 RepID=UPI0035583B9F